MMQLLAPAGSADAVKAAVRNGADAVYMPPNMRDARRRGDSSPLDDFAWAAEYCRIRNVKIYFELDAMYAETELLSAVNMARDAQRLGADAIILSDVGLIRALRKALPDMPLFGSRRMGIQNVDGARYAAAMGLSRAALAAELTREEIAEIAAAKIIDLEIAVQGELCPSYGGQCFLDALSMRRGANRAACASVCRLPFTCTGRSAEYPLSMKELCLAPHIRELEAMGIACAGIVGTDRRPEYVAAVTGVYADLIKKDRDLNGEHLGILADAAANPGFTDGYYTGQRSNMFAPPVNPDNADPTLYAQMRREYGNSEMKRIPVRLAAVIEEGKPVRLAAMDDKGNTSVQYGAEPAQTYYKPTSAAEVQTALYKITAGPFYCAAAKCKIDENLEVDMRAVISARNAALAELENKRRKITEEKREAEFSGFTHTPAEGEEEKKAEVPFLTVSVMSADQLSPRLAELAPRVVYIPLTEFAGGIPEKVLPFVNTQGVSVAVIMPRFVRQAEWERIDALLDLAKSAGVREALVSNIGHVPHIRSRGFDVRGDFGLNSYNSESLEIMRALGIRSATLPFELGMEQIWSMKKPVDTELIVYGRLPLMVADLCLCRSERGVCTCDGAVSLTDRSGFVYPIEREFNHRSSVLSARKIFLADVQEDYLSAGLWGVRLRFTTENAAECAKIAERYLGLGDYTPGGTNTGLYYRNIE